MSINASRDQVSLTKWVYGRNIFGLCFLGGFIGFVIVMVFCFVSSCVVVLVCMLGKFLFWDIPYPVGCTQGIPVFPGILKQQRLSPPGFGPVSQEVWSPPLDPHLCFAAEVAQLKIYQTKFPVTVSFWFPGVWFWIVRRRYDWPPQPGQESPFGHIPHVNMAPLPSFPRRGSKGQIAWLLPAQGFTTFGVKLTFS